MRFHKGTVTLAHSVYQFVVRKPSITKELLRYQTPYRPSNAHKL